MNLNKNRQFLNPTDLAYGLINQALEIDYDAFQGNVLDVLLFCKEQDLEVPGRMAFCVTCERHDEKSPPIDEMFLLIQQRIRIGRGMYWSHPWMNDEKSTLESHQDLLELSKRKQKEYIESAERVVCVDHLVFCEKPDCGWLSISSSTTRRLIKKQELCDLHFNEQWLKELEDGTSPNLNDIKWGDLAHDYAERGELLKWVTKIKEVLKSDIERWKIVRKIISGPEYQKIEELGQDSLEQENITRWNKAAKFNTWLSSSEITAYGRQESAMLHDKVYCFQVHYNCVCEWIGRKKKASDDLDQIQKTADEAYEELVREAKKAGYEF